MLVFAAMAWGGCALISHRARGVRGRYESGYATLHPVETNAAIPIYPSLAEGTSDRWARGEVRAHLDALRP